jgi:hypothetical protein
VPLEDRGGVVMAVFLDPLMVHLALPYYAGLLTSA